jgi:hypothetical protein
MPLGKSEMPFGRKEAFFDEIRPEMRLSYRTGAKARKISKDLSLCCFTPSH